MNTPDAPAKKQTPLESALTPEQKAAFGIYLKDRTQSIKSQLESEFWAKRDIYAKQMEDDFSWRAAGAHRGAAVGVELDRVNDIFDLQNDSLNIVGGFAAFMTARTADDIFGTEPFYSINPEGIEDAPLAGDMQKHSEWKLRQSAFRDASLDALDLAMGQGEGILKIRWHREIDIFEVEQSVLHIDGQPFATDGGEYITEADLMPAPDESEPAGMDPMMPEGMEPMEPAPVEPILTSTKAPDLRLSGVLDFRPVAIEQTNISFNGVKVETMHYRDFLVPLTAESLEDADFVGHRFQMRLSEAKARFSISDELASKLATESDEAKAEKNKPRNDEVAEGNDARQIPDPEIGFVECWVKCDPIGDGRIRRCYVLLVETLGEIVEMDYMANRTPQGQLPFFCVRAYKVKNRWYGRGFYQIYEKAQEYIDRQLNRIEYRNRFHSNPAIFFDHTMLDEDEDSGDFELRPGKTYRKKKSGVKMEDIVEVFTLPDLDDRTYELMQFMIQIVQVRSGVTSAAQGEVSSLPSTATATGIESIMQSASVLARLPMGLIRHTLEKALLYAVKLIYANFDRDEVFTYFEGDEQKARTLAAERVQNIDMNVRLLLTRFKAREDGEAATKAIQIGMQYVALPEPEKGPMRPLFIQGLKALGFDQADTIIREPLPPPPMPPPGMPGQPPGPEDGMAGSGAGLTPPQPMLPSGTSAPFPGVPAEAVAA